MGSSLCVLILLDSLYGYFEIIIHHTNKMIHTKYHLIVNIITTLFVILK